MLQISVFSQTSIRYTLPPNPEIPWKNDPDISSISDMRVLKLWEMNIVQFRRENPYCGSILFLYSDEKYYSQEISLDDQQYLIDKLEESLKSNSADWNYVRIILLLMQSGMDINPKIPELADHFFKMSRPVKMSKNRGLCYKEIIKVLALQPSIESANLFYNAAHRDYWGADSFLTPGFSKKDTEESILKIRCMAITFLSKLPCDLSLPLLEKLKEEYIVINPREEQIVYKSDGIAYRIESALREKQTQE